MVVLAIFGAVSARGGIRIFGVHKKAVSARGDMALPQFEINLSR